MERVGPGGPIVCALLLAVGAAAATGPDPGSGSALPPPAELRTWIAGMKASPKGPFEAVRWFCKDGSVLPPKAYACRERGGGVQHGLHGPRARLLRENGYEVATVLASLDPTRFTGEAADLGALRQLLLERFLVGWDDGWIFRRARSHRGALQMEDEELAAERLALALLADPAWRAAPRFFLLRETIRALPLSAQPNVAARVRSLAAQLADADPGFADLRAKLHGSPDAADAKRVRDYARGVADPADYETLAGLIEELFRPEATAEGLRRLLGRIDGPVLELLRAELPAFSSPDPRSRLHAAARALEGIRREFAGVTRPATALAILRASLLLEREAFASAQAAALESAGAPRRAQLALLGPLAASLFGAGLVGERHLDALRASLDGLAGDAPTLGAYRDTLSYLARASEWSRRWVAFHFGEASAHLASIEPLVELYAPDRLRGSPLLAWSAVLDRLADDAQRLAGAESRAFGKPVGAGLRALNPGIARGVLRRADAEHEIASLPPDSVALLPETAAELPPVAAILTLGEGSSLSHVQLLARNLGIPNAVVGDALAARLYEEIGRSVEVRVSPGGVVQLDAIEAAAAPPPDAGPPAEFAIRIDPRRLELDHTELMPLDGVRARHSGRRCGPKAANLGALRAHFGDVVPDGFVIPFGVFRALLEEPIDADGPSAFEWLVQRYAELAELEPDARREATAATLERIRAWITTREPGPGFRAAVAGQLARLGGDGVFVRSDTNVEDLPGFTGAGLNLTVPNVVGTDAVVDAIRRVWASPFGDRAYAWRQAHMDRPELVFPSVLVQRAFPAEKSGVLVTMDVDTGDRGVLTVALGEGVGGAVDGQAVESLRIDRATGAVHFLAQATAPTRTELDPVGGVRRRPASGAEFLLREGEAESLRALADRVEGFPALRREDGSRWPADVEFAFRGGELALLQIRPFVESRRARESEQLRTLDAPLRARARDRVALDDPIEEVLR